MKLDVYKDLRLRMFRAKSLVKTKNWEQPKCPAARFCLNQFQPAQKNAIQTLTLNINFIDMENIHNILLSEKQVSQLHRLHPVFNLKRGEVKVAQPCLTLCDPMDIKSVEFSRPEYRSGQPFPSLGIFCNPGIKPRFPSLQVDFLPAELRGKTNHMENACFLRNCRMVF